MLKELFELNQRYLDHFFDQMDLTQAEELLQLLLKCEGTIFLTGIGKSGIVNHLAVLINKSKIRDRRVNGIAIDHIAVAENGQGFIVGCALTCCQKQQRTREKYWE